MLDLKVVVVLTLLQALSSMAANLYIPRGENSGEITALFRNPKGLRSVPRDLHIRQNTCPTGSYECSDGGSFFPMTYVMYYTSYLLSRQGLL